MGFFKTKEEKANIRFDKGSDLIAQKQFDDALRNFNKIIDMGQATAETYVLKQMLMMRNSYTNPNVLAQAIECFSKYPGLTVKYGVYDVSTDDLRRECEMRLKGQTVLSDSEITIESGMEMIRTATEIQPYDRTFLLDELFAEKKITGTDYANMLFALGYEKMSEAIKWSDPKKAAEYQQQALFYNRERHDTGAVSRNERFINEASMTVHCWFCGKEITGENIHFVPMPCDMTSMILDQSNPGSSIPTNGEDCVYACRACFSSFDYLAKAYMERANAYTDREVAQVRMELYAEIERLRSELRAVAYR